jgi:hypothetical protein
MDRRALFFVVAAVVCAALAPATEDSIRWIPIAMAAAYVVFALLSVLDFWSRHQERDD